MILIKFNNFHSVTIEQDSIIHQTQIHWSGSFFRRFSKQFFFCQSSKRFHLDFFYFMAAIFSLDHFLNHFDKNRSVINPLFYYKIMKNFKSTGSFTISSTNSSTVTSPSMLCTEEDLLLMSFLACVGFFASIWGNLLRWGFSTLPKSSKL